MEFFLVVMIFCGVPFLLILLAGYFFGRKGVAISSILLFILIAYALFGSGVNPDPSTEAATRFFQYFILPLVGIGTVAGSIVGFIRN